ncbi:uncharacterized protein [Blastocystis hominis]|uniref:Micro-fibrillar-associated protein 1 C-terminal domain-containing protein n=1 Tax=Blastocystis hominis TaxID=12968 RepID=D8LWB4_BLAHO|nr:uncharacterized protein [Blastocystis hominis]CBK20103.2 unnamed protein product [Blastocystis hominis]|eukprot:XP_012894151.1 uncharacterized protein [Blastocystis hominis]
MEAKLREMQENATMEEEDRKKRVEEEERRAIEEKNKQPVFLAKMNKEVFGNGDMTLEGRIASRRHYNMKE